MQLSIWGVTLILSRIFKMLALNVFSSKLHLIPSVRMKDLPPASLKYFLLIPGQLGTNGSGEEPHEML